MKLKLTLMGLWTNFVLSIRQLGNNWSLGALFYLTKNSRTFETGANGTESSLESFRKIRKLLNFRNTNHSTENSGMKIKWNRNSRYEIFKNLGIAPEVVLFSGNGGKCRSIRHWKFPEMQTEIFQKRKEEKR